METNLILPAGPFNLPDAVNAPGFIQGMGLKGKFMVEHRDKEGALKGLYPIDNAITNQGKNYILNAGFNSGSIIATGSWYIGLIDNSGTPTLAAGDLLSSHAGWTENTGYTGNRQAWGQATSTAQSTSNASPATFPITAAGNLFGLFIASVATAGSSSDILWSTAAFSAVVPVSIGDSMKASYTLAC